MRARLKRYPAITRVGPTTLMEAGRKRGDVITPQTRALIVDMHVRQCSFPHELASAGTTMIRCLGLLLFWSTYAAGQGLTRPIGIGHDGFNIWKPDVQMPIPEKVTPHIVMEPETYFKPSLELHTKGFCVPRMGWQLQGAYAVECPANTYLQTYFNGKQVCAATRCTGPFGADKKSGGIPQLGHTGAAQFVNDAVAETPAQYWGGDAGTICNTVLLKPIMTCGDGCLLDNRLYGDWCLCPEGPLPCPYNQSPGGGYQWCQCPDVGPPFGFCVADGFYCSYYCQYAPTWIFTSVAKGAMLCPIDPVNMDPYKPDAVFPGWEFSGGGNLIGRR